MTYPHVENVDDYNLYIRDFKKGSEGLEALSSGHCPGCEECGDDEEVDPHFSHSPCNICRRQLGGDRYPAHYMDDNDEINHLSICADCVYYLENGQLDDMTMMDIQNQAENKYSSGNGR